MNWESFGFPMEDGWVSGLVSDSQVGNRPGTFFKGEFELNATGDTFFDVSGFKKGVAWINGHNLGRYWEIGPQKRLYCPASWLKQGNNTLVMFDLLATAGGRVRGVETLR